MEEFLVDYPSVDLPDIQDRITAKKEFLELAADVQEPVPLSGQSYKSQRLFLRHMIAYDRILNFPETGTGKTCSVVAVAEYYERNREHIKHVYILQKPSTIQDFRNQILCKCTGTKYQTDIVKNALSDSTRKSNVTRELNKWYTIYSYHDFSTEIINGSYTDEQIIEKYSGCIFVVDEAHNLRNEGSETVGHTLRVIYNTIHRVFQLIKRSKIIISTATPMINGVEELARIANLALPSNRQMPLDWDYSKITLKQLEVFLRGYVFYVRGLDTGATPVYMGETITSSHIIEVPDPTWDSETEGIVNTNGQIIPRMIKKRYESQVKVFATFMGDIQEKAYNSITGDDQDIEDQEVTSGKGERFHLKTRQANCFVFPNRTYGGKFRRGNDSADAHGIGEYVTSNSPNEYTMNPDFKEWLSNPDNLSRLSGKYSAIVNIEKHTPGCGFCYNDYVTGSGAIMLGMCFEANGFERFDERSSVFIATGSERRSVCPTSDGTRKVKDIFKKGYRYALLTSETPDTVVDSMLELFNSEENIDGEYIKCIIGSPVARDGINIFNVVRGHLVTPGWHPSGMHQALSRFLRAVSHDALIRRLRLHYESMGITDEPRIDVQIYLHVAVSRERKGEKEQKQPIDLTFYLHAESKNIKIHRLMRMLKQIDVACRINYTRNVRPATYDVNGTYIKGDVDGLEICDYDICEYKCTTCNEPPSEIDYTTYDAKYADEISDKASIDIIQLIRQKGTITFKELKDKWVTTGIYREKFIYMAVERLLSNKQMLLDRYGLGCYLHTDGHNIYTQREFPTPTTVSNSQQELSVYGEQLIAVKNTPFEKFVNVRQKKEQYIIIDKIKALKSIKYDEELIIYNDLLDQLVTTFKVELLETAIISYTKRHTDPYIDVTIARYKAYIYTEYEPWEDILTASKLLSSGKKVSGKLKSSSGGKTRPKFDFKGGSKPESFDGAGRQVEIVYFHTLYSADVDLTEYSVTSNYRNVDGVIRLYKASFADGFRDADPNENLVYGEFAQREIRRILKPYSHHKYYGIIHHNKKFRIRKGSGKETESGDDEEDTEDNGGEDQRSKFRGRICSIWNKPDLIDIVIHENLSTPKIMEINVNGKTRVDIIRYLQNKYDKHFSDTEKLSKLTDEKLLMLYRWCASEVTKDYLCSVIRAHFVATHKIHVV